MFLHDACVSSVLITILSALFVFLSSLSAVRGGHGVPESRDGDHSMDTGTALHSQMMSNVHKISIYKVLTVQTARKVADPRCAVLLAPPTLILVLYL